MIRKIIYTGLVFLFLWIGFDLFFPTSGNFQDFDPKKIGNLDSAMWRSYYEHKSSALFLQLAHTIRTQFDAPFWRSFVMAYQAAKAALIFQKGQNRADYAKALPWLEKYYGNIHSLSKEPFDIARVAKDELEWWIIRREPETHTPADWETLLGKVAAEIYHIPPASFDQYARLRVEAMVLRDNKGKNISENDWKTIDSLLQQSWSSLHEVIVLHKR